MARSARSDAAMAAAGLALLGLTWMAASATGVTGLEEWFFRLFNNWPDWVEGVFWPVMQLGTLLAVGVGALAATLHRRDWWPGVLVGISGVAAWSTAKLVKGIVARGRPQEFFADGNFRPLWEGHGFVSGHAAVAFALVAVLVVFLGKRWSIVLWTAAVVTAIARVYTGAHLPLDVIGGAGLGLAVAGTVRLVERRVTP